MWSWLAVRAWLRSSRNGFDAPALFAEFRSGLLVNRPGLKPLTDGVLCSGTNGDSPDAGYAEQIAGLLAMPAGQRAFG